MAITRIKNNQITDGSLVASSKLSDNSITAGKLANNLTYGSNFTISGNLTVNGTTTTVDTNNMTVDDPLLLLASNQTGSGAVDIGFIGERGDDTNVAFVFDESDNEFAVALTSTGDANTTITITDYADLHAGGITADDAITATGNVTGGNLVTAGDVTTATVTASGAIAGSTTITATGNITGGNLNTGAQVVATGNITGGNLITAGELSAASIDLSGDAVVAGNLTVGGDLAYVNVTTLAVEDPIIGAGRGANNAALSSDDNKDRGLQMYYYDGAEKSAFIGWDDSAGKIVIATDVDFASEVANVQTAGTVVIGTAETTAVTASTTVTATGNVTGGNLTTAGDVTTATVTASGAIAGSTTITATGNITGGNLNTGAQVVATGNITGGNLITSAAVESATVTATGNVTGGNLITSAAVESATVTASGAIVGASIDIAGQSDFDNVRLDGNDVTAHTGGIVTFNDAGGDVDFRFEGDSDTNLLVLDAGADSITIGTATQTTGAKFKVGSTDSMMVPVGTTAQRPGSAATGMLRFNTSTDQLEFYDSDSWTTAGSDFTVIASETFDGDGSTVAFTLSDSQTTASCIVSINGVVQLPTTAYGVSTTTLTFTEAPLSGDKIEVRKLTTTSSIASLSNADASAIVETQDGVGNTSVTGNLIVTGSIEGASFVGLDATTIVDGTTNVSVDSAGGPVSIDIGGTNIINVTSAGITNGQADGVGNIGSSSTGFNTVFAKATSAQYADLAEMYAADADIEAGTVVIFGGDAEVTTADQADDHRVAGVVSTNPSYLMNSNQAGDHVVPVAFTGRVPCKVTGTVAKGDLMVSAGEGKAKANNNPAPGTIIGKALEASTGDATIEVVVGRF